MGNFNLLSISNSKIPTWFAALIALFKKQCTCRHAGALPWGLFTSTSTSCHPPVASSWNIWRGKTLVRIYLCAQIYKQNWWCLFCDHPFLYIAFFSSKKSLVITEYAGQTPLISYYIIPLPLSLNGHWFWVTDFTAGAEHRICKQEPVQCLAWEILLCKKLYTIYIKLSCLAIEHRYYRILKILAVMYCNET